MTRLEFSKPTRRAALLRSGGHCEAVGAVYGLEPGRRCNAPLAYGVEFDHYPLRAADGGDASLENCAAVCKSCHRHKTATFDTPQAAKGQRVRDKHDGITSRPKRKIQSPGFRRHPTNVRQLRADESENTDV